MTVSCTPGPSEGSAERAQWALPERLREISGLALTNDNRLLAVTDELAIVYEIDYENGRMVKEFALDRPAVRGDFEGIAMYGGRLWLMTSDARLLAAVEGEDGEYVSYERFDTDLGGRCEFEGLVANVSRNVLALVCKEARKKNDLAIYEWAPDSGEIVEIELPEKAIEKALDSKRVRPSGIDIDPVTGNYIVLAAGQNAVFSISPEGEFIDVIMRLDRDRHRQAEGIAIAPDGRWLIADEGGSGRARLTVYRDKDGEE